MAIRITDEPTINVPVSINTSNERPIVNVGKMQQPSNDSFIASYKPRKPSQNEKELSGWSPRAIPEPYDPPFNFGFSDLESIHVKNIKMALGKDLDNDLGEGLVSYWDSLSDGTDGLSRAQYSLVNPFRFMGLLYRTKGSYNRIMQLLSSNYLRSGPELKKDPNLVGKVGQHYGLKALLPTNKELAQERITNNPGAIQTQEEFYKLSQQLNNSIATINSHEDSYSKSVKYLTRRLYLTVTAVWEHGDTLEIQVPFTFENVSYTPEATQAPIHVLGRSLKRYHYTGGEDTLELKVVWKKFKESDLEPITSALSMATLTRPNENGIIPNIYLHVKDTKVSTPMTSFFGIGASYILTKAPFKSFRFSRYNWPGGFSKTNTYTKLDPKVSTISFDRMSDLALEAKNMGTNVNPQLVEQTLTFKRISADNLTGKQLYRNDT